jgi:hypothetical protein
VSEQRQRAEGDGERRGDADGHSVPLATGLKSRSW